MGKAILKGKKSISAYKSLKGLLKFSDEFATLVIVQILKRLEPLQI